MSKFDDNLEEIIRYGRYHDSSRAVVQKFNILRLFKENKEFIFVEGNSDETFYKNTSISILRDKSAYLYADYNPDSRGPKGKKVVYAAYETIRNNDNLRYELDKCLFIIDKDYEYYKKNHVFTITEGHSMECYFLERENVDIIFSYFKLTEADAQKFWALFVDFAGKCYEFYALKGTWTYIYDDKKRAEGISDGYRYLNDFASIFRFEFRDGSYSFCEEKLEIELKLLRDALNANNRFIPYYEKLYADIKDNPRMIRGHDAYEFLKQYLLQVHGITIHNNLKELIPVIKDMGVELNIKQIESDL